MHPVPSLAQVAFCVSDLPATLSFYCEGLGFLRARGMPVTGPFLARVQGLGDDARCIVWWVVGRQDFVQLEFFHHTLPPQRPRRADWRPSDLGFARIGVAVPDIAEVVARVSALGGTVLDAARPVRGSLRACIADPDGNLIELFEDDDAVPGGRRAAFRDARPAIVYAAVTVPDLTRAHAFYAGTLGIAPADVVISTDADEARWGLLTARATRSVYRAGDVLFEVSQYSEPASRPREPGFAESDQGFLNVAFGFRERPPFDAMVARATAAGYRARAPVAPGAGFASTYLEDGWGGSVEVFGSPRVYDEVLGFEPDPVTWPAPR
jgi:catechol 2,3-dioxygenase-like lactoylglutathione lyase family enzyme